MWIRAMKDYLALPSCSFGCRHFTTPHFPSDSLCTKDVPWQSGPLAYIDGLRRFWGQKKRGNGLVSFTGAVDHHRMWIFCSLGLWTSLLQIGVLASRYAFLCAVWIPPARASTIRTLRRINSRFGFHLLVRQFPAFGARLFLIEFPKPSSKVLG